MHVEPLQPWETALVGEIAFENGAIVSNDVAIRIDGLLASGLLEATAYGNWCVLYRDRVDGRLWELTWPQGSLQGGGPPSLHVLSVDEARERYPGAPLAEED